MLQNLVLPEDLQSAKALSECCYSCLNRAQLELKRENLNEAERWVKEFQRCKKDLDKLIDRKKQFDNMKELAKVFHEHDVDVEKVLGKKIDHSAKWSKKNQKISTSVYENSIKKSTGG